MILQYDIKEFSNLIRLTALYYNVEFAIIEKDYYVTLFLYELKKYVPELVFKGGTSLSKCLKVIDRFS